jgi:hypothetical protein
MLNKGLGEDFFSKGIEEKVEQSNGEEIKQSNGEEEEDSNRHSKPVWIYIIPN